MPIVAHMVGGVGVDQEVNLLVKVEWCSTSPCAKMQSISTCNMSSSNVKLNAKMPTLKIKIKKEMAEPKKKKKTITITIATTTKSCPTKWA